MIKTKLCVKFALKDCT